MQSINVKAFFPKRGIIVSCQAMKDEPLYGSEIMAKMAIAAEEGGAVGIRANSPQDIKAIKNAVNLPVIGIYKDKIDGYDVYITPTKKHIDLIVDAGADLIALDCTRGKRPQNLGELFTYIREKYGKPIVADVADLEDALNIMPLKPDFISTTLSGYTEYSKNRPMPDIDLVREIQEKVDIPVIAEGNYTEPDQIAEAFVAGAFCVVVGGAITRPQQTTKRFVDRIKMLVDDEKKALGIDLGGTHVRGGIVDSSGEILKEIHSNTKVDNPLESVKEVIDKLIEENISTIGIGTAGRVDFKKGKILYATGNLLNWTGVNLKNRLEQEYSMPVTVDNDVNAAAYAHWIMFKGKIRNFAYIAVGTGLGGGIVIDGKIRRGLNGNAGEFGHIVIPGNEKKCTCGKTGCIETLLSGRFISKKYEEDFGKISWEDILKRLQSVDEWGKEILNSLGSNAAWLVDVLFNTLDLEKIYFGGIVEDFGDAFLQSARRNLIPYIQSNHLYSQEIVELSPLKKNATIIGSALESLHFGEVGDLENE